MCRDFRDKVHTLAEKQAVNSLKVNVGRQAMAEAVFVPIKPRTKVINAITATKISKYVYNLCAGLTAEWPKSVQKPTSIVELVQALQGQVDIGPTPIIFKDLAEHPNQ